MPFRSLFEVLGRIVLEAGGEEMGREGSEVRGAILLGGEDAAGIRLYLHLSVIL